MFDWMLPEKHAIAILKKDHDVVKDLFDKFEKAEKTAAKEKIIDQAITSLKIHAILEEEIFGSAQESDNLPERLAFSERFPLASLRG